MKTFKEFIASNGIILKSKIHSVENILIDLLTIPQLNERRAHDITIPYWSNSKFIEWLKELNVELPDNMPPKYVDGGAGRCYFLVNEVVKMSMNRVEANVAAMVAGRNDLPTPILAVQYLGDNLYAILQKWIDTKNIQQEIKDAADFMTVLIDDNPEMEGFPSTKKDQKEIIIKTLQDNDGPIDLVPYMMLMMDVLITLYNATGFKHDDAGPTNIGMDQGKVVIPDLGPNEPASFDTLKSLSQIQKNREKLGLPKWKMI